MNLDLINLRLKKPKWGAIVAAMEEIGFLQKGLCFTNTDTDYFVEFPEGPLSVGEEPVKEVIELTFSTVTSTFSTVTSPFSTVTSTFSTATST